MAKKTIEEKYRSLSEIEHCLAKPGMWIGSTNLHDLDMFLYDRDEELIKIETTNYIPGMLKLVDEVISNSCDEYRRKDNLGLNKLCISVDIKNKSITIYDNGGIPVVKHKEAKCYVPEFIFGNLRTSSNYDDTEDRAGLGTNGVGSALTNIFSTYFKVETSDGKKLCTIEWSDNMSYKSDPEIENSKKNEHHTKITFKLDWDRFETNSETWFEDFCRILEKRSIDAAIANPGLEVTYSETDSNNLIYHSIWKFKNFKEYVNLYKSYINPEDCISFEDQYKKVYVYPDSNINVGFVNGAECSKGTHIKELHGFINNKISEFLKKKDKIEVTPRQIDGKYSMFCELTVSNPTYDSQTKETLTLPVERFYKDEKIKFEVPDKFLDKITKSEIVNIVRDWYKQKQAAEDQKTIRQLNRQAKSQLKRPDKYIECNTKKRLDRQLWIFEGDSAKAGFRQGRDPQKQAGYCMRGVPMNVYNMTPAQIMKNEVFSDLVSILGLQFGKDFDVKNLNYGKIVIAADADVDGDKISSLLLVFYNLWPELFEKNIVCRSVSPIIIVSKGKNKKCFYSLEEYRKVQNQYKGWSTKYTKGLGGLSQAEFHQMMHEPIFMYFNKDNMADSMIRKWFSKDNSDERKNMLSE
ncbi:MAG: hypothetical protein J1F35_06200 [Erysipelotrichales bacterium]|nr:hypothetical protein [Erysipelotrichales bacterium]